MEIRNLRYFYMTAELGNFTRAADKLSVSQPALSSGIKNLERELKCLLLKRGKRVTLTAEGKKLKFYCDKLFLLLDEMEEDISLTAKGIKGMVKAGILESLLLSVFPEIIAKYANICPEVMLKFEKSETAIIEKDVLERNLDFGIISREPTSTKLEGKLLANYEHCLVCSNKDKDSLKQQVKTKPLYILGGWQEGAIKSQTDLFERFPKIKLRNPVNCVQMLREIVASGLGLAILPSYVVKKDIRIPEKYSQMVMRTHLIYRKNKIPNPTVDNFITNIISEFA